MRNEEIERLETDLAVLRMQQITADCEYQDMAVKLGDTQSQLADCERKLAEAMGALEVAAGRLFWCGSATPGCSDLAGKELAMQWADETRAFLEREKSND